MGNGSESIIVMCEHCGAQTEKPARRLEMERDLVCTECGTELEDHREKLKIMLSKDRSYPFDKLRLRAKIV
jgi:hypothetical protein